MDNLDVLHDDTWTVRYTSWPSRESEVSSQELRTKNSNLEFSLILKSYSSAHQSIFRDWGTLWFNMTKKVSATLGTFTFGVLDQIKIPFIFDNKLVGRYFVLALGKQVFLSKNMVQITIYWKEVKKEESERKVIVNTRPLSKLAENFNWLLESGVLSDGVIETEDGTRFSFHKSTLAARSPVFLAMFKSGMLEAKSTCVKIIDLSADTVKNMLTYLYTGCIKELTHDSYSELLRAADKYDIPDLKQLCARHLLLRLDTSNAVDLLLMMDLYRMKDSKDAILSYIAKNRKQFSKDWSYDALKGNSTLLLELLRKMTME